MTPETPSRSGPQRLRGILNVCVCGEPGKGFVAEGSRHRRGRLCMRGHALSRVEWRVQHHAADAREVQVSLWQPPYI